MSTPTHVSGGACPLPCRAASQATDPCVPPHLCRLEPSRLHIWLHPRGPPALPQSPVERLGRTSPFDRHGLATHHRFFVRTAEGHGGPCAGQVLRRPPG